MVHAQDVPPGQFHEAPALLQAGQACVDESLACQAVEDGVHSFAVRGFKNLAGELRGPAVEQPAHAKRPEIGLLGRARSGEDLRARGLNELNGGQAYSAGSGVDKHASPASSPESSNESAAETKALGTLANSLTE